MTDIKKKIKCLNPKCNNYFVPKKRNQIFCNNKCYYINLNIKTEEWRNGRPNFMCPNCRTKTLLDFSPLKDEKQWLNWNCPKCGYTNETNNYYKELFVLEKELHNEEVRERIVIIYNTIVEYIYHYNN